MKFKLSQITVLVVSALSVSAGVAATIDKTIQINNNIPGPVITGDRHINDTIKYTGSVINSPNTTTFVGHESEREGDMYYSHRTENDGSLTRIGVNYDYEYFYSAAEVDTLAITDSSVRINGKADNLTVGGKSVVTITGSDAYSNYRGASYEKPSEFTSSLTPHRNGYDNNRRDETTVSTGNGTYNDESKQYLDGEHIGDVKKPVNSNATLTIKGTDVTDARLGADKGEYLVATGDTFDDKAEQHVGERSLSQGATFNGQSSQHLKGKDGKKAVSLDATFTGTSGVKHTGQTVGSNGLAIDSTFDYANQDISSGGVAKNNTLRNGDQNVSGEADNTKITNGNQTVSGKATTNSIDNTGAEHGIQVIRGKAEDNTLSNTDQRVEKDGIASVKNDITDGSQFVDGFAENNTISNKATNRGKQVINGTANNNKLTETDQFVGQNGTAGIKNDITNGSQYVDGLAENNIITNKADKRGEQVISGTANNNKLTNTNQIVKKGGMATDNTLTGNSHLTVENGGETKNNTLNGDIDMIVEANGKATGKTTFNGKNHLDLYAATTNGAYVEDLALSRTKGKSSVTVYEGTQEHDAVTIGTLNGKAAVNFDHRTNPAGHTQMNINNLGNNDPAQYDNTTSDFTMNSNILNGNSDFINTDNAYGQHYVTIIERDTGKEAVLNRPQSADFAYVKNVAGDSNAVFGMKDADGKILDLTDAGTYIYNIQTRTGAGNDTTWSFTATDRLTPSARAVLALSSAPQLMYNNEVDHLRARLHMLRTSDSIENGLWMQGIGSNTKVDKDQIQYKLKHAGLELGADYQLALNSDSKLVLGGFTGFDKGDVKNDWAGTSDLDSYTFGAYATYLNTNGWYADTLLKYNHFDNKLKTTSTNGYGVSSDNYSTSVWGMALETGYTFTFSNQTFITPYGQLAYNRMGSKDITLNNGMDAAIKSQTSLTSELGVNAGKDFSFDNGLMFSPYVKAAWNHQYEDGNEVEFNRYNTINLDLSGSTGKFGAGFNARYNNVNMFMELQHIAGDAVYSPINGQIGIRYNF
ncbi:autotransporter outer membrane beta-barrel domain-containing protein [Morganella morganii]|uniref:autotransporter outer membrane beta-barrel domain-containing protein n=1 Tax=Morganella morganii TaxID=582 RepID=UPI00164C76A9|nr:autotransporter outer membrane beta-barrel domain-containing protein [Morganella morganii]MBC4012441.1 autotransporter outer membrane beta-barrel domain-containing protein [Morganella morganii]